uniref:SNF8 subunit of ESCRT-II n=1 Tax=Prolemur simus TaxID=1328070 RepID=A0A8C9A7M7_PROSS
MHRRGVGAGAIAKKKLAEAKYKERGTVLAEDQLAQMSKQLDMFKTNLEEFASKHKQEIRKNPEFRVQFQDMCATIGVDPLACKELFLEKDFGLRCWAWGTSIMSWATNYISLSRKTL